MEKRERERVEVWGCIFIYLQCHRSGRLCGQWTSRPRVPIPMPIPIPIPIAMPLLQAPCPFLSTLPTPATPPT